MATTIVLTALDTPKQLTYFVAEGATGSFFDADVIVANPNDTEVSVTYTFSTEDGKHVVIKRRILPKSYTVPPMSRFNIDASTITELQNESFGAVIDVTNDVRIFVERSMYWDVNGVLFSGGTNATGIRLP